MLTEIAVDTSQLRRVGSLLKAAENGAVLRKELVTDIRVAVAPGVEAVRSKLRSMPSSAADPAMGGYLASRTMVSVRLAGSSAGIRVRIPQTPGLRGFKNAARRLNQGGWRHPVYGGHGGWVSQSSPIPGFFDKTLAEGKERYRAAVELAVQKLAATLTKF